MNGSLAITREGDEFVLRASLELPVPRAEVFEFFSRAENLERVTPPELAFRIATPLPIAMRTGTLIDYTLGLFGVRFGWRTEITRWNPPIEFEDTQLKGPYAQWIHRHCFRDLPTGGTAIEDVVRYRLPLGAIGRLAHPVVRWQLRRIFRYREATVRQLAGGPTIDDRAPFSQDDGQPRAGGRMRQPVESSPPSSTDSGDFAGVPGIDSPVVHHRRSTAFRYAGSRRELYADAREEARLVHGRDDFVWRARVLPIGVPLAVGAGAVVWRRRRSGGEAVAVALAAAAITWIGARVEWGLRRGAHRHRRGEPRSSRSWR